MIEGDSLRAGLELIDRLAALVPPSRIFAILKEADGRTALQDRLGRIRLTAGL
jgi:hypothetical protein